MHVNAAYLEEMGFSQSSSKTMAHLFAHLTVRAPIGNSLVTFLDPKKFADLTFR